MRTTPSRKLAILVSIAFLSFPGAFANPVLTPGLWYDLSPVLSSESYPLAQGKGIAVDPSNPSTIYYTNDGYTTAGAPGPGAGMYKTTDGGSTWSQIGPFQQPIRVRVDPKNPLHLYAGDGVRGSTNGFWVSTDAGATWAIPAGFKTWADSLHDYDVYQVEPDPADFSHVLVSFHYYWNGGNNAGILESFDGGASWTKHDPDSSWAGTGGYDVLFLYNPKLGIGDNKTWLYCTQGAGYWRTTNAGTSWTRVTTHNMTHGGNQIYYAHTGVLYSGGDVNLIYSTDNGVTWTDLPATGDHYYQCVIGDGTTLYTQSSGPGTTGQSFIVSPEASGTTWTTFSDARKFNASAYEMAFDSLNRIVYASMWDGGLLALKLNGPATVTVGRSALHATNGVTNPFVRPVSLTDARVVVSSGSSRSGLFAVDGRKLGLKIQRDHY